MKETAGGDSCLCRVIRSLALCLPQNINDSWEGGIHFVEGE